MHLVLVGQHLCDMASFDGTYVDGTKSVTVLGMPMVGTESLAAAGASLWLRACM